MDQDIDEARIGKEIRDLRKLRRLRLEDVSREAGISIGHLSQIERGRAKIPIGTLKKIGACLGVNIHWFFHYSEEKDGIESKYVVRSRKRRNMTFPGMGISEELLSPDLAGPIEFLLSTIEPGADSEPYSHEGAEAGYVLKGVLDLWISGHKFRLEPGDSFAFESTSEHRCANPGDAATQVLWVITPPHY